MEKETDGMINSVMNIAEKSINSSSDVNAQHCQPVKGGNCPVLL